MDKIYRSQPEYLEDVLKLCAMRLSTLSDQPAGSRETIDLWDRKLRRRCENTVESGSGVGLEYLFRVFGLTDFERHCVMLALAGELSGEFRTRYRAARPESALPTLELCLTSYSDQPQEQMLLLCQWRADRRKLADFFCPGFSGTDGDSDLSAGLKLQQRIVDFALDFTSSDPEVASGGAIFWPDQVPPMTLRQDLLRKMKKLEQRVSPERKLLFYLSGAAGSGRRTLVRRFCCESGRALVLVDLQPLTRETESWEELLRPFLREAVIRNAALAFTGFEVLQGAEPRSADPEKREFGREHIRCLLREAAERTDRLFLISDRAWQPETPCEAWERTELELQMPDADERQTLWEAVLRGKALEETVSPAGLADQFALQPGQIAAAAEKAEALRRWEGAGKLTSGILLRACRAQLSSRIGTMAARVNAAYDWEDLILPQEQKRRLMEACNQVQYRRRVYGEWGFGERVAYGRGVSMLFSGPPGTGKTMAAQVIANRLGQELYQVDLSGVMSKYIGDTEKHLGAVFEEVRKSQSILFFDEADALFGKRSEVRDSHDRYANVQTSYLLQKIEEYDGVVILASNLIQNFDEAFKRRIKFVVEFTLPDRQLREQIWRSVLPADLPIDEDVDFEFLARSFELSGSSIKNSAVAAAFLAASEGVSVQMVHLLRSIQAEQQKAGKSVSRAEFGEYASQMKDYENRLCSRDEDPAV